MSPVRKQSIVDQLHEEFPPTQEKLPTSTSVGGRAMELTQMSYLQNPREGGKTHEVFDANSVDKSFPAVDIFATQKDTLAPMLMLQSKAHLQTDVKKRASAFKSDLKQVEKKSDMLSKRVHPEEGSQRTSYGESLEKKLKTLGAQESEVNLFKRTTHSSDDEEYLEGVHDKRDSLSSTLQERIVYPVSPLTHSTLSDPQFVSLPVHTADIQSLVDEIPHREVTERKRKHEDSDDADYSGGE